MDHRTQIYLMAFIGFLIATSQFVISGILDKIALSLGVPIAAAGQLMTVFSLSNAIGTPLIMMATAKVDRRKLMLVGLSAIAASLLGTALLPRYGILMALRALLGVGFGVYGVSAYTVAVKLAPEGRQATAMATIAMGASLGLVIGVPAGRLVAGFFDWPWIFLGLGLMVLGALIAVARIIPSATGPPPPPLVQQLRYLKEPRIAAALGVAVTMFISYAAMNTYIAPFLAYTLPLSDRSISAVFMALGLASTAGAKTGGMLADRTHASRAVIAGISMQMLSLLLVALLPKTIFLTVPLLMCWSAAAWTAGPMLNFNLISLAPGAAAILLSLNGAFVQLGFASGAAMGGLVVSAGSMHALNWTAAASAGLAGTIAAAAFWNHGSAQPQGRSKLGNVT